MRAVLEWLRLEARADDGGRDPARIAEWRARTAEMIGNRSYETGLPCGTAEIRFADPIWPDGRGARPDDSLNG